MVQRGISEAGPGAATLETSAGTLTVPQGYAEKTMASLMQLHQELMEEKERRVELYRRLMDREKTIHELRLRIEELQRAPVQTPGDVAVPAQELVAQAAPATATATAYDWKAW